jgi:hypothetical protein
MIPDRPLTVKLRNGEKIEFSVEEMNHPDFRRGWEFAEQNRGALHHGHMVKIGNLAYRVNRSRFRFRARPQGVLFLF